MSQNKKYCKENRNYGRNQDSFETKKHMLVFTRRSHRDLFCPHRIVGATKIVARTFSCASAEQTDKKTSKNKPKFCWDMSAKFKRIYC